MAGVLIYTSKMPDHAFATAKQTVSVMPWSQYGTKDTYTSSNTTASAGNRAGAFSWLLSVNYQDSWQQPLTYTTSSTIPTGTAGAFPALNKSGQAADVIGTGTARLGGNAMQLHYTLEINYDGAPLQLKVEDWMWLIDEDTLMNESILRKWGFKVGSVQLVIKKQKAH